MPTDMQRRVLRAIVGTAVVAAVGASVISGVTPASAATGDVVEFPAAASSSTSIAAGPDGNLWFAEQGSEFVGRITTAGVVTKFAASPGSGPASITAGPDGNLWFTEVFGDRIGRITPTGVVAEFALTPGVQPRTIAAGPDGNLWFTEQLGNNIGRITTSGVITEFPILTLGARPRDIVAGPDGNLWFAEEGAAQIGRITTSGAITEFPVHFGGNIGIAAGSDGNLWFTSIDGNSIGRITTDGVVTDFPLPTADSTPIGIALGSDGNLWFTQGQANQIGRITTFGAITEFPVPTPASRPFGIAAGPNGSMWFTEFFTGNIGRIEVTPVAPLYAVATNTKSASGNNSITATLTAATVPEGDTITVSVSTGTFAGAVGCSDTQGNDYTVVADRNTGHGRLFICSARVDAQLAIGDAVTAAYPGFSGLSLISINGILGSVVGEGIDEASTGMGNSANPTSGPIVTTNPAQLLFGVVAHNSTPTFSPTAPFTTIGVVIGGSGSGTKTLTPAFLHLMTTGTYALTGQLSSAQQWRAGIIAYAAS